MYMYIGKKKARKIKKKGTIKKFTAGAYASSANFEIEFR